MSHPLSICSGSFLLWQISIAAALANPADAQWGRRFSLSAGPAIVVDEAPPHAGIHLRGAAALLPGVRTVNLLADSYLTWLFPDSERLTFFDGSFEQRLRELQLGLGLSAFLALSAQAGFSPYLLAGGVYRWSDVAGENTIRDPAGQITNQAELDQTEDQLDILVGLGFAIRSGTRRVLIEARAYGGTTIYIPVTVGLTF